MVNGGFPGRSLTPPQDVVVVLTLSQPAGGENLPMNEATTAKSQVQQ